MNNVVLCPKVGCEKRIYHKAFSCIKHYFELSRESRYEHARIQQKYIKGEVVYEVYKDIWLRCVREINIDRAE